jgi:hypothetical protein
MKWENDYRQYSYCGSILFLGKWEVGGTHYDSCRHQGDPLEHKATCRLPGIKSDLGNFVTEEEAKTKVEETIKYWINKSEI